MNHVHEAMRTCTFLNPNEETVVDDDADILAAIVHAQSVDEARAYKTDEDSL
jgi:hypothetical protein